MQTSNFITINTPDFDNLNSKPMVIIDFWANWCQPCKTQIKILQSLAIQYPQIIFAEINIDDNRYLGRELRIQTIPALLFFENGQEIERMTGLQNAFLIENTIKKVFLKPH